MTDHLFDVEFAFTEAYRRCDQPALREAQCLTVQYPAICLPVQPGDRFAGRIRFRAVGFTPHYWRPGGGDNMGYYCDEALIREKLAQHPLPEAEAQAVEDLLDFWRGETTAARIDQRWDPALRHLFGDLSTSEPYVIAGLYRLAGAHPDFDTLLRLGLPGLRAEIAARRDQAQAAGEEGALFEAMQIALDVLERSAHWYAEQLRQEAAADPAQREDRLHMADILEAITQRTPQTLREAIQLVYLYSTHTMLVANYGRMDVYLGDFYVHDLEAGRLTEAEAFDLVTSFWRMMRINPEYGRVNVDTRVIIGGRGRRNEAHADRFALLALEVSRCLHLNYPQLSLRFYQGMNPAVYAKALDVLGEGTTFPILYNDDVNIPAVQRAFGVDDAAAADYVPFGCGEYVLNHASYGTPNVVINLAKALEQTLRGLPDYTAFEDLWDAYDRQVQTYSAAAANLQALTTRVIGEQAPCLYLALLYDDCLARGQGMFDGGLRHLGGTYETYGNITTADSLTAIRTLVYERRALAPETLLAALDADFAGYEDIRALLLAAPKYGNDDDTADGMAARVHQHIAHVAQAQAARAGLDSYLIVVINNDMHVSLGRQTGATADGRHAGKPLTNGNTPTNGMDQQGITALLNSIVKLDPGCHAGATHNLKLSPSLFRAYRPQLEALLNVYWAAGGTQLMITVVSREDLLNALKDPQKYAHLMVRVGGFSARFIDLSPDVQQEIISRTLWA